MSGTYSGQEVLRLLQGQRREVQEALSAAERYVEGHLRNREALSKQYQQAVADLGTALLPQLDPAWLSWAVHVTGYAPFRHHDPIAAREEERARLRQRLATIESDRRFSERELLRHPRTGTLIGRRQELAAHRAPWADVLERADHPRLERLLEVGYGTDRYAVPFWRLSYYQDWEAGDAILERFPGMGGFGALAEEIRQARETVSTLDHALAETDREIAAGVALETEHAQLVERLRDLDARWLDHARGRIVEHLLAIDPNVVKPIFRDRPEIQLLYLRASGIVAKVRYLDAIVAEHAEKLRRELPERLRKVDREIQKFRRPKNLHARWPRELVERRTRSRAAQHQKHFQRFEKHYQTVWIYEDWARARAHEDFLWWFLMTRGRVPGHYIPEVQAFVESHPQWAHGMPVEDRSDWDDAAAAAAIALAGDDDRIGSQDFS